MQNVQKAEAGVVARVAILLVAASLLLVPVRCDASPDPHSIFVDPAALSGQTMEHSHHAAVGGSHHAHLQEADSGSAEFVPAGDPAAEVLYVLEMSPAFGGDPVDSTSAPDRDETTTDLKSMNGAAGMFDSVFSVGLRSEADEQRVVVARVLAAPPAVPGLTGRVTAPSTPPPR